MEQERPILVVGSALRGGDAGRGVDGDAALAADEATRRTVRPERRAKGRQVHLDAVDLKRQVGIL